MRVNVGRARPYIGLVGGVLIAIVGVVLLELPSRSSSTPSGPGAIQTLRQAQNSALAVPAAILISGTPNHISIPSLGIDLDVIQGYYNPTSQSWTLSLDKAQYATVSQPANNQSGMTFIYAHNRPSVFNKLPSIQPGAKATVGTTNGHNFTYIYRSSAITKPTDASIFSYTGDPILVVQTCTGKWYEDRQLFVFNLEEVS